ncbi:MAG: OB-fold nucleic acid binding domain-containing protein [Candidatus Diapherotrites archaeon]|nr:OB-fold nucleic acid binding domain-containing protein [Candidatus Diapherotrites archaeon]
MRSNAMRIPLKELEDATFVKVEEQYVPSYVLTKSGLKVSRVSVWGVVVRRYEDERFLSLKIDDFTGTVDVMAFDTELEMNSIKKLKEGDSVKVIGKLKQGNNGIFIAAENALRISFSEEMLKRLEILFVYNSYLKGMQQSLGSESAKDGLKKLDADKKKFGKEPMLADFIPADELDIDEKVI